MAKFVAGNDPAEHTNAEVVEFLTGDDATPDEYERVMEAERGNRARVGILNLTGVEEQPAAPEETAEQMAAHPEAANADVVDTTTDPDQPDATPSEDEAPEPAEGPISASEALRRAQANIDAQVQERLSRLG